MRANGWWVVIAVVVGLTGCGGGKKAAEDPSDTEAEGMAPDEGEAGDDTFCEQEKMDGIDALFRAKKKAVVRCYTNALEAGKIPKTARGHIQIAAVIQPNGSATDVEITDDTLRCDDVCKCVIVLVKGWEFPGCPAPVPYTYQYNFVP